jgi:hypothetical protein
MNFEEVSQRNQECTNHAVSLKNFLENEIQRRSEKADYLENLDSSHV